jgi:hypothetical protein
MLLTFELLLVFDIGVDFTHIFNNINSVEFFLFSFNLAQQPYTLPTRVPLFLFKDEQKKNLEKQFCTISSN